MMRIVAAAATMKQNGMTRRRFVRGRNLLRQSARAITASEEDGRQQECGDQGGDTFWKQADGREQSVLAKHLLEALNQRELGDLYM